MFDHTAVNSMCNRRAVDVGASKTFSSVVSRLG